MTTRQGELYTTTKTTLTDGVPTDPTTITITLKDPSSTVIVDKAAPTKDAVGQYHYDYTFSASATPGNWTFRWTVDGVNTDEVVPVDAKYTVIYVDSDRVLSKLGSSIKDTDSDLIEDGLRAGDDRVNMILSKNNLDPPIVANSDLTNAAIYFASSDIEDSLYTQRDNRSPSAVQWEKIGNEYMESYIDSVKEKGPASNKYQHSQTPRGHTLGQVLGMHRHHHRDDRRLY